MQSSIKLLFATLLTIPLITSGCTPASSGDGKTRRDVTAAFLFEGTPIVEGQVNFENLKTGDAGGAKLNSSGKAVIPNLPLGSYSVTVVPILKPVVPGVNADQNQPEPPDIPAAYRQTSTSPLKAEVANDGEEFLFELKAKPDTPAK